MLIQDVGIRCLDDGGSTACTQTGESTDDRLLRGHGDSREVVGVEIGVGRLPVDGGAGVRVNDNIKEWYHSVRTGMFNGIFQVRCYRV